MLWLSSGSPNDASDDNPVALAGSTLRPSKDVQTHLTLPSPWPALLFKAIWPFTFGLLVMLCRLMHLFPGVHSWNLSDKCVSSSGHPFRIILPSAGDQTPHITCEDALKELSAWNPRRLSTLHAGHQPTKAKGMLHSTLNLVFYIKFLNWGSAPIMGPAYYNLLVADSLRAENHPHSLNR